MTEFLFKKLGDFLGPEEDSQDLDSNVAELRGNKLDGFRLKLISPIKTIKMVYVTSRDKGNLYLLYEYVETKDNVRYYKYIGRE